MVAITALLALHPDSAPNWLLGASYALLYAAAVLTLYSMFVYLRAAWRVVLEPGNESGEDDTGPA